MMNGWGWTEEVNSWKPVWMTIPEAASACSELIKCGCKSNQGCTIFRDRLTFSNVDSRTSR